MRVAVAPLRVVALLRVLAPLREVAARAREVALIRVVVALGLARTRMRQWLLLALAPGRRAQALRPQQPAEAPTSRAGSRLPVSRS